ncbi:M20/M25/M40 family metallo-hydrolase [Epilithonimonas arachidiradicis]|uniref:Aminopeptidase n=1 Tax=Epilithonimonas arachidiradicis TaxID=1617282 RepID=A0A420DBK5_9FLAO|nr:M20/M25/M40 family metallo-hydrolase [Epilithonimonas arachidiradicis]RKE88869.1 PDZ domain-containing protein [Epilithonimonas arachidiradicis]GGG54448.1 aminopeptidase [Epilithonimonas arachidiradicis]
MFLSITKLKQVSTLSLLGISTLYYSQQKSNPEQVNEDNLKKHIYFLASDELQGRLTGSEGEAKAAKYLSSEFKKLGLKPYEGKEFIQNFEYSVKLNPHDDKTSTAVKGKNVIAVLDNKAEKTIVIGAHYDHLGLNEHHNSTLANSDGQIHNGADDNASGTAAVLELARMFSQNKTKENVNYVFALFSGEEDGLMGSKKLAETIKTNYPNTILMINMDMIGRLNKDNNLTVGGVGTSPILSDLVKKYKPESINLSLDESGVGPSDHTSFYLKDIPVLFLFTGTHNDYHKPTDDADKINYAGQKIITSYVFNLANALGNEKEIPFTKTAVTATKAVPKYKVSLGIMPNYADTKDGMGIDGVIDNRPAANVGILQGDVLTKIGKCEVKEVYSYMDCLSKINAGEEYPVTVKRNGEEKVFNVKF